MVVRYSPRWPVGQGAAANCVVELPKVGGASRRPPSGAWQFVVPDQLILLQNAFSQKRCLLLLQVEAGDVILRVNEVDVNRFSTKEGKKTDLLQPLSFSLSFFLSRSRYNAHSPKCTRSLFSPLSSPLSWFLLFCPCLKRTTFLSAI